MDNKFAVNIGRSTKACAHNYDVRTYERIACQFIQDLSFQSTGSCSV